MCFVSCTKGLLRIAVLFVISSIIIIRQAPANNAELHLTTEEIQALKPRIKMRLLILFTLMLAFSLMLPRIAVCISFGVAVTAALLLLSRMGMGAQ